MGKSRRSWVMGALAAASVALAACSSSDEPVVTAGGGSGPPAFPTAVEDYLPSGDRIDVSAMNLFPMGAGDSWTYNRQNSGLTQTGIVYRVVSFGPDATGRVVLTHTEDGYTDPTHYLVNADGLLLESPTEGYLPPSAQAIIGTFFEYATPLYPQGSQRRHVRSGPVGADFDGDGIQESFSLVYEQVFVGFETIQIPGVGEFQDVARFRNTLRFTIRYTDIGDYGTTSFEEAWFAPNLGLVKAIRSGVDSFGAQVEPENTIVLASGTIGGTAWPGGSPPPSPSPGSALDGQVIDVPLTHKALVYDNLRNVYYASVPGSVIGNGNAIATVDPATGQVTYSAAIGSEPNAMAVSADGSMLYVGLDGSGEVVGLHLPGMTEAGRVRLVTDSFFGQARAETIAVSPVDPTVFAVAMAWASGSPRHAGVALVRDMVMQPNTTQTHTGSNLIAFDASGTTLYGLNTETTEYGLRRIKVLADGVSEELVVHVGSSSGSQSLAVANGRVIAGSWLYDAPQLAQAGVVSGAADCLPAPSGWLLCVDSFWSDPGRIKIVDAGTFVIQGSLLFDSAEPSTARKLVPGASGLAAISYPSTPWSSVSKIRIFTSTQLATPNPASPSWPVSVSATPDGQARDVGLRHNFLVYDELRNVYYASVPGSVIGAGNSIATVNPSTGEVTHSLPVGSEPNALARSADGGVLYVGLDGSGEVAKLQLPSMTQLGRVRLAVDSFFGQARAETVSVSPTDSSVFAVSMAWSGFSPRHAGVALVRDMALQPKKTQTHTGSNLIAFDSQGTTLYGLNIETSEFGLRSIDVLADGLAEDVVVRLNTTGYSTRALGFAGGRVVAGNGLFDAQTLAQAGLVSSASDCWPARTGGNLLCLGNVDNPGRVIVADSGTFVIASSLVFNGSAEPWFSRRLVQGPPGQVAISYPVSVSTLRMFSSAGLP